MKLAENVYRLTVKLPQGERRGLISQMRGAAVSVPSNIAEGYGRQATGEYRHHLSISRGSLLEVETQVLLCERLGYLENFHTQKVVPIAHCLVEPRACDLVIILPLSR